MLTLLISSLLLKPLPKLLLKPHGIQLVVVLVLIVIPTSVLLKIVLNVKLMNAILDMVMVVQTEPV